MHIIFQVKSSARQEGGGKVKFYITWAASVIIAVPCAPFYIFYASARNIYYKFKHSTAEEKNKFRRQLQQSEYEWGSVRAFEAGVESSGQLILQVWLLTSSIGLLQGMGVLGIFKLGVRGVLHFITLFAVPASDQGCNLIEIIIFGTVYQYIKVHSDSLCLP